MAKRTRVDLSRIAAVAARTALNGDQPSPRRRRSGLGAAAAAGAALAVGAQVAAKRAPSLVKMAPKLTRIRDLADLPDQLRDRLADSAWLRDDHDVVDEDLDGEPQEEDEGEDAEDDEEEDQADEDGEAEDGEDEAEDGEEDAQPDEEASDALGVDLGASDGEDGARTGRATPSLMSVLSAHRSLPPALERKRGSVDPVELPPEPPKAKPPSRRAKGSKTQRTTKRKAGGG